MANWDDLDQAFSLPDWLPHRSEVGGDEVAGSEWRTLYARLLTRTQAELGHLELSTPEVLLVERYLTGYILLRWRESLTTGDIEGFATAEAAKNVNEHWLRIAKEVTALIDRARTRHGSDMVNKKAAAQVVVDVLSKMPNDGLKRELMMDIASAFDRMGA